VKTKQGTTCQGDVAELVSGLRTMLSQVMATQSVMIAMSVMTARIHFIARHSMVNSDAVTSKPT
jgi:hypothetical protein